MALRDTPPAHEEAGRSPCFCPSRSLDSARTHVERRRTGAEEVAMGSLSIVHWIIIIAVALLLFGGRGKISSLMGDFAEGIKAFKKGMAEDEKTAAVTPPAEQK